MTKPDGYIACIYEGTAEKEILTKLLDNDKLIFCYDDLLENKLLHTRSPKDFQRDYLGKAYSKPITVLRVLDSRSEAFNLKKEYQKKVPVINVITAPEIEMLLIIAEGEYDNYQKVKSIKKPSDFCASLKQFQGENIKSSDFIKDYFSDIDILIHCIVEYKRLSNVRRDEVCLADLLKP